jgi:urease accessory protein UreF
MHSKAETFPDWIGLGFDSLQLWNDAAAVILLRGARIAQGGASAASEAERMISEKFEANAAFMMDLATGTAGASPHAVATRAVGMYGKKVRDNRRRLLRQCS